MTSAPMTGRDTAAAFKGLVIGLVAIAIVVLSLVYFTNKKFEGHEQPTVSQPH